MKTSYVCIQIFCYGCYAFWVQANDVYVIQFSKNLVSI